MLPLSHALIRLAAGFFSTRPVLGYRPVVDGKLASTFRWLTWAELWRRLAAFHAGIFQLFPTAKKVHLEQHDATCLILIPSG